jgi:hypothetical protein
MSERGGLDEQTKIIRLDRPWRAPKRTREYAELDKTQTVAARAAASCGIIGANVSGWVNQ